MVTKSTGVQFELLDELEPLVEENLNQLLDIDGAWQPSDFLPDFATSDWAAAVEQLQRQARALPDELLAVLVGNMITEEALPSYAISLNRIARDKEGDSPSPWGRWMRGWIAEENRHGDLLNTYLRLTGRVDMRAVEVTTQHLIARGSIRAPGLDPYAGLIYTSFQERATTISHANVGRLVAQAGDPTLAAICKRVASDEGRHEKFYTRIMRGVFDRDPEGAILMLRTMMKRTIAMPAKNMFDGETPDLYDRYATAAQRLGVYTILDYANIVGYLVRTWDVAGRSVTGHAAKAQEFLCVQAERLAELAAPVLEDLAARPAPSFRWLHPRPDAAELMSSAAR